MTDRYAVVGNPIDFSKSPAIHMAFAATTGQDIEYTKVLGPPGEFGATAAAFRAAGGRGMNVTAPFKLDAFEYATERSSRAEISGAANALKFEGDKVIAENFDGVGLVRDVAHNLAAAMKGKRVLLLGAGGAARGAVMPFVEQQPASLVIANRTPVKAHALAAIARAAGAACDVKACGFDELREETFDVVFNATSASLRGELPAVPATAFRQATLAYELAYGKGLTPFLRLAKNAGVTQLADGVGMLVEQAAEAFAWWRGIRPETASVIRALGIPLR